MVNILLFFKNRPAFPGTKCVFRPIYGRCFSINNTNYALFPLELTTNEKYKHLSPYSKILYALFLNRLNLSKMNSSKFCDKNGLFIYYTNAQIRESLCCSVNPAVNALKELENYGLIRKEYQKNGLPLKIYVNDVFGVHTRTYNKNVPQPKPQDKPEPQYKNDFKSHSHIVNKEKSYDMDKIDEMTHNHLFTFAEKKK
ncbi:MAG: replication initiator protein A, partial [Clostridia bacterium]|nr:replication initiator protein A [Clostridia bacterium]